MIYETLMRAANSGRCPIPNISSFKDHLMRTHLFEIDLTEIDIDGVDYKKYSMRPDRPTELAMPYPNILLEIKGVEEKYKGLSEEVKTIARKHGFDGECKIDGTLVNLISMSGGRKYALQTFDHPRGEDELAINTIGGLFMYDKSFWGKMGVRSSVEVFNTDPVPEETIRPLSSISQALITSGYFAMFPYHKGFLAMNIPLTHQMKGRLEELVRLIFFMRCVIAWINSPTCYKIAKTPNASSNERRWVSQGYNPHLRKRIILLDREGYFHLREGRGEKIGRKRVLHVAYERRAHRRHVEGRRMKDGRWIEYRKKDQWVRACRVGDDKEGWQGEASHYRLINKLEGEDYAIE